MGAVQDQVNKWIHDLPRQLVAEMIDKKLRAERIRVSKQHVNELAIQLLAGEHAIQLEAGDRHKHKIVNFTDEDLTALQEQVDKITRDMPAIIDQASERFSLTILGSLKKTWRGERRQQRRDLHAFHKRLDERWGLGIESLRMLVTIAREFGDNFNKDGRAAGGGPNPKTFDVLTRLHARACQVSEEVICLISNGFADGAMARWRTMHEIAAVSYLLDKHGDPLAERYVAHQIVEARGAAVQYRKYQERLRQEPISEKEFDKIEADYQAALNDYGAAFGSPYGWAADHIGKNRPTVADIQEAATIDYLSPYYKMASHNVHANPKGVFFKLGLVYESEVLLAGPSNAGFADPGHATALSLMQISSVLMRQDPTADSLVTIKVMQHLVNEIGDALLVAHQKLVQDERLYSEKWRGSKLGQAVE
jgi:hypothetical protein